MRPSHLILAAARQVTSLAHNPQILTPTIMVSCISAQQEAYPLDTLFPRKNIYKWTWYSPNGRTRNALDHILISSQWKSSITNCRVYRGDQLGNTDHSLLIAQLRLKLKATTPKWVQPRLRASHLLPQRNIVARFLSRAIYVTIYEQTEKKYRI